MASFLNPKRSKKDKEDKHKTEKTQTAPTPTPATPHQATNTSSASSANQDLTKILCDAAWENKHTLIAKILLGATKEDVNGMSNGKFPLYLAARNNSLESVLELLNFDGISIDTQLATGSTPAHAAAWFGHAEILALLLASGSSSLIKNDKGLTSRDEAQGPCKQVYKLYEQSGPAGLKQSYPVVAKLKQIVTRKSVPIRNKKTIVHTQVHFFGTLAICVSSTSNLTPGGNYHVGIQVGDAKAGSPSLPYSSTIKWDWKHEFPIDCRSNIPIRFSVHNQSGEAVANLDLPISLVAGEEFQKAMGGSLQKSFNLRTAQKPEGDKSPAPEMKLTLQFTKSQPKQNVGDKKKVFDLVSSISYAHLNTGMQQEQSFLVAKSRGDLATLDEKNPPKPSAKPTRQAGTLNQGRKYLVSLESDDDVQTIVAYNDQEPFASGTFGSVYVGTVVQKGITVAVKVITLRSEVDNQKLAKEVYIQFLFDPDRCQNLLPLNMAFQTPNHFTLVMPLCKGGSLQDKLDKYQYIKEPLALSYAKQSLLGIQYLHSLKVVHRDLKPLNIMFDADDILQIIDFGESEFFTGGAVTGEVGTPWYAAPEIFGEPSYNESVDLYAIGVTVFELLYGDVPWFWYDKVHDISNPQLNYDVYPDGYRTFPLHNPIDWDNLMPPQRISPETTVLLKGLICMNPDKRLSADKALAMPLFKNIQ